MLRSALLLTLLTTAASWATAAEPRMSLRVGTTPLGSPTLRDVAACMRPDAVPIQAGQAIWTEDAVLAWRPEQPTWHMARSAVPRGEFGLADRCFVLTLPGKTVRGVALHSHSARFTTIPTLLVRRQGEQLLLQLTSGLGGSGAPILTQELHAVLQDRIPAGSLARQADPASGTTTSGSTASGPAAGASASCPVEERTVQADGHLQLRRRHPQGTWMIDTVHASTGRLISRLHEGVRTDYSYNDAGLLSRIQDSAGDVFEIDYATPELMSRLVHTRPRQPALRYQFSYNPQGQPTLIDSASEGAVQVRYDEAGKIVAVESDGGPRLALRIMATFVGLLQRVRVECAEPPR